MFDPPITLDDLLIQHAALAWEKQMYLGSLIQDQDWQFDMSTGRLSFGDQYTFDVQLLGTEGFASNTWLWAWANTQSEITPALLIAANTIRSYGEQVKIDVLVQPQVPITDLHQGHIFSMIASGLYKANAYYRGPYEGGALFMLIKDDYYPQNPAHPIQRIVLNFPQMIGSIALNDHQRAFIAYLEAHNLIVKSNDHTVVGTHPEDRMRVVAEFDALRRLVKLESTLNAQA